MISIIKTDEDNEFDPCPMGCGRMTDDVYGGPCSDCEKDFPIKD